MAADSIDIGLGSGPGLAFIAKGSPVKGIAAMAGPPLIFALVVRNDGSVKSVDDLKGKEDRHLHRRLDHELARRRGVTAKGLGGDDAMTEVPIGEDGAGSRR